MQSNIEKVTLSLDKALLIEMAQKSNKSMSEFVRDLIQREKALTSEEIIISTEILSLKGSLSPSEQDTKQRVHDAFKQHLKNYDADESVH